MAYIGDVIGMKTILKMMLPDRVVARLRYYRQREGIVRWGSLRRLEPVNRLFGTDRGTPIDRHYIESFLEAHSGDIAGEVLEIAESTYSRQFGAERVAKFHVLHAEEGNPDATLVGDLESGRGIPENAYDCMILTQTLPFIFDFQSAIRTCHRALRDNGVLLATMAGISQISRYDMDRWGDYWRFTSLSAQRCFADVFGEDQVMVQSHGNVLTSTAFLHGLVAEDLRSEELDHRDSDYQLIIAVRAKKMRLTW